MWGGVLLLQFRLDLLSVFHHMLSEVQLNTTAEVLHLRVRVRSWFGWIGLGGQKEDVADVDGVGWVCLSSSQSAYFGKSRLAWHSDMQSTQDELNMCGVMDLVMDLVSTPDDGGSPALRQRRTRERATCAGAMRTGGTAGDAHGRDRGRCAWAGPRAMRTGGLGG